MSYRNHEFASEATRKAPLPGYENRTTRIGLSADDIEIGLNFCKWLHTKRFLEASNKANAEFGLTPHTIPTFLKRDRGQQIYDDIRRELIRHSGSVMLVEAEIGAVRDALIARKRDITRPIPSGAKRAEVQLTGVQKFVSNGKRRVRGLASAPSPDRVGDIVEPRGGSWKLPVPLLWQHSHKDPVGWVRTIDVRNDGLWIEAEFAENIGRADEVWRMVDSGLLDSFSIGFRSIDWKPLPDGGKRFTSWELLEISVVAVPAHPAAKISRSGAGIKLRHGRGDGSYALRKPDGSVRLRVGGGR